MRAARRALRPGWLLLSVVLLFGCSPAGQDHAAMPHGDHNPKFGGLVLMERDIHFEVVARPSGQYQVYFSDERRNPLPASTATDVIVTVMRPSVEAEVVALAKDAADEKWSGEGRPVESDDTMVRIGYVYREQPYWIDLPFAGWK